MPNIGTKRGIIVPYARGLLIKDIEFINFVGNYVCYGGTQIDGMTEGHNGGFTYQVATHSFANSPNKIAFRWLHDAAYKSLDDTFTGTSGEVVVACADFLPPSCTSETAFSVGLDGCACDADVEFHRFSFNHYSPGSLEGKEVAFTTQHGSSVALYKKKRVTHKFGWMALLPSKEEMRMQFVNAEQLVNISYDGVMYDLEASLVLFSQSQLLSLFENG